MVAEKWCLAPGVVMEVIQYDERSIDGYNDILEFMANTPYRVDRYSGGVAISVSLVSLWLKHGMYLVKLPADGYIVLSEENFRKMFHKVYKI